MIKKICKKCGMEFEAKRKDSQYCDGCSKNRHKTKQKEKQLLIKFKDKYSRKQFYVDVDKPSPKRIIYSYTRNAGETDPRYVFDAVNTNNELIFECFYTETTYFETEKGFIQTIELQLEKEALHTTLKEPPVLVDNHLYKVSLVYERIFYQIIDENAKKMLNSYLNEHPDVVCVDITAFMSETLKKSKINKENRTKKLKKEKAVTTKKDKNMRVFRPLNYSDKVNWDIVQFDWDKEPVLLQSDKKYYTGWIPGVDFIVLDKYEKNQPFISAFLIGTVEIKDEFSPSSDMTFSNKTPSDEYISGCKDYSVCDETLKMKTKTDKWFDTAFFDKHEKKETEKNENWVCDAIEVFRKVKDVEIKIEQGYIKRSEWVENINFVLKPEMTLDEGFVTFRLSKSEHNYYCVLADKILFVPNRRSTSTILKLYAFDRFPTSCVS